MRDTPLFRSIRLGVADSVRLREFYIDRLELPELETGRSGFAVTVGASRLEFSPLHSSPRPEIAAPESATPNSATPNSADPPSAPHHFAFNIPRNRLEEATDWLSSRVDLLRHPDGGHVFPFPSWDAQALYALDPAGNIVEWIARHAVANDVTAEDGEAAFDASHMLEVSEIGVVTGNVSILAATLRAGLVLPGYRPATQQFAALGDERGLFILVKEGRPWFPTEVVATPAPAVVEIDGRGLEPRRFAPAGAMLRIQIV